MEQEDHNNTFLVTAYFMISVQNRTHQSWILYQRNHPYPVALSPLSLLLDKSAVL